MSDRLDSYGFIRTATSEPISEMVYKVAQALCIADGVDPEAPSDKEGPHLTAWEARVKPARAAIEAMRHPHCEMEFDLAAEFGVDEDGMPDLDAVERGWNKAIDSALTEFPINRHP